ncbi:MAG: CHASE domain-containing protein [Dissulfurispiraceae bacterium]
MTYNLGNKTFRYILFALILIFGVAMSIIISAWSYYSNKKLIALEFNEAVDNRYSAFKRELDSDISVLTSLQALYYTSEKNLERSEFRNFTSHILNQHASIKALEWIPLVTDTQRKAYEQSARKEGFSDFQFTELVAQGELKREERRKEYFPVYFVEPYKGNEKAFGFDLASNPTRLEALEFARKTGETRATARITLVQETKSQFGFIVFAPIYKKGVPVNSDQARWDNLEGFALGVFRIGDIAEKAENYLKPEGVDIFIYDESAPEKERFLYAHSSHTRKTPILNPDQPATDLTNSKMLEVAGRKWMVIYAATPDFIAARGSWLPWGLLLSGLALTGLVVRFLLIVSHADHVERYAKDLSDVNKRLKHEIGERKHAEEALRQSQEQYRLIVDTAKEGIWAIDEDRRISFVNARMAEMLQYEAKEIIGRKIESFIFEEDRHDHLQRIANRHLRVAEHYERRWRRKDEQAVWTIVSATPIIDPEHHFRGAFAMILDITDRKLADEDQKKSLSLLQATLESTADGILVVNDAGKIASFNSRFVEMWRLPDDMLSSMDARGALEYVLDQLKDPQGFLAKVEALYSHPEEESFDVLEFKDGRIFERYSRPQRMQDRIVGRVWSFRDVTERKNANEALSRSEKRYRELFENMIEGVAYCKMIFDSGKPQDFIYLSVNAAFETLTGLRNVAGKRVTEVIPGILESDPELIEIYSRVSLTGKHERFEIFVQTLKEWFSISVYSPEKEFFVAVFDVITERKKVEKTLAKERKFLATILDTTSTLIVVLDTKGAIIRYNAECERLTGISSDHVKGRAIWEVFAVEEDISILRLAIASVKDMPFLNGYETSFNAVDRSERTIVWTNSVFCDEGVNDCCIISTGVDVTDRKALERELIKAASIDKLTALINRQTLDKTISREIERAMRYHHPLSVIMFDIDHFKRINDTYGHLMGDSVLREVAVLAQANLRTSDSFGRWGGEEFMIVLPETSIEEADLAAEKLRCLFERQNIIGINELTASFGVAGYNNGDNIDRLIKRVDDALYAAKQEGRNRVVCKSLSDADNSIRN